MDEYDRHFRLLICGGSNSGKSSLLSCFSSEANQSEGTTVLRLDDVNIRIDVRKKDEVGHLTQATEKVCLKTPKTWCATVDFSGNQNTFPNSMVLLLCSQLTTSR
ncbi:unnamed protein product [Nippostrongylus brasiliensis]|uniref:G domain-containing protein n=1 Tax=Nippostrongylus brasiliensis TaxID=27835 RepID=A0A0N4XRL8_NIPBR|nr:unnamed protein product [Nippostrongylus brasiliensis]